MKRTTAPVLAAVSVGVATILPGFLTGAMSLQIARELGFGVSSIGLLVGSFFLAAALGSAPGGALAQRIGAVPAMRLAASVAAVALLATALVAHTLPALVACLLLGGLANALAQPAINLHIAENVAAERRGLVFGVKQSSIPLAVLLSGLALPLVALPLGWRWTYAVAAALALAPALVLRGGGRPVDAGETARARGRDLRYLAAAGLLASSGPNALGAFLVTTAVEAGISESGAGLLLAAGSVASVGVRLAAGWLADRRADHSLRMVFVMLLGGVAGFVLISLPSPAAVVIGALVAFALGWGWAGVFNLAVVSRHIEAPASASGFTQTGIYAGAAVGPLGFGVVAGTVSLAAAWLLTAVLVAAAAALIQLADGV